MISKENMRYITEAIKTYNILIDKNYLICFNSNVRESLSFIEVQITEKGFWHLVGCRFDACVVFSHMQKSRLYKECLNGNDISAYLNYTDTPSDVKAKCVTLKKIFNFIKNAKILKITDTIGTPEQFMFTVGIGSYQGLVGYIKDKNIYFPKTAQDKSIDIKKNVTGKIRIVLSKPITAIEYGKIEYEIGRGIYARLSPQIISNYQLTQELIDLIPNEPNKHIR